MFKKQNRDKLLSSSKLCKRLPRPPPRHATPTPNVAFSTAENFATLLGQDSQLNILCQLSGSDGGGGRCISLRTAAISLKWQLQLLLCYQCYQRLYLSFEKSTKLAFFGNFCPFLRLQLRQKQNKTKHATNT